MEFPDGFVWGAASSAYQVEGGHDADGKGPSVWDEFCRRPGAIWQGHTGDVACDHYHRYPEDIALMKQIGPDFESAWNAGEDVDDDTPDGKVFVSAIDELADKCP